MKKVLSLILALALCAALGVPALAANGYGPVAFQGSILATDPDVTVIFEAAIVETKTLTVNSIPITGTVVTVRPGSYIKVIDSTGAETTDLLSFLFTIYYLQNGSYEFALGADVSGNTSMDAWFLNALVSKAGIVSPGAGAPDMYELSLITVDSETGTQRQERCYVVYGGSKAGAPVLPAVVPSAQKVIVDGAEQSAEVYNIDGRNYFKLRDLATMLTGTGSQFEVEYDDATGIISVTTGAAYSPVGGEMAPGKGSAANCVRSSQKLTVDGRPVSITAYNLGGSNFFQLKELGEVLGFDVEFHAENNAAVITSR